MFESLRRTGRQIHDDERGASLIEYALLLALIAVVCFGAVTFFGNGSGNSLTNSCDQILGASNPGDTC